MIRMILKKHHFSGNPIHISAREPMLDSDMVTGKDLRYYCTN
jgi:hypothetical protein